MSSRGHAGTTGSHLSEPQFRYAGHSRVTYTSAASRARLEALVGRSLAPREVVGLAGAPAGAQVEARGGYLTARWQEGTDHYEAAVILSQRAAGDYFTPRGDEGHLTIGNFAFARNGVPAQMRAADLARQLPFARSLGVRLITQKGRDQTNDWEHLPRLGYNAPVDEYLKAEMRGGQLATFPSGVKSGPTLQDVLSTAAGRQFWHDQGEIHPTLYFDTAKGSRSVRMLNAYRRNGGQ